MGKPPADVDPEKFIIGKGLYDNLQVARPYADDRVFRVDPAPMPWIAILVLNLVFIAFFCGFSWVAENFTHGKAGPWFVYGAPIGLGLLTCVLVTGVVYYSFDKARRQGSWLVYDKGTGRVELPREGVAFDRSDVVHVQYITTKRLSLQRIGDNDQLSELNLITCRNGVRKRWPMLRSIFNIKAFDRLLEQLLENTDLPVMRVKDEWLGWHVTETPYVGKSGRKHEAGRD